MSDGISDSPEILSYFVDEAGDPVLFDRKGNVRVGTEGCSKYFILGKLDVDAPEELRERLDALRAEIVADPYFRGVPSMQPARGKTAVAFHAKDDLAEVRREVYKLLASMDLRFYAVIRDKTALVKTVKQRNEKDRTYRYSQDEQYDTLVSELFRHLRRSSDVVSVCFAKRGSKNRTEALNQALEKAGDEFERSFGFRPPAQVEISSSTPKRQAGLQAADYFLWAVQRYYERDEERYLSQIWPQVGEIHDLDRISEGRLGVIYSKKRPILPEPPAET